VKSKAKSACEVVASAVYTAKVEGNITYEGGRKRATSACSYRHVSVGVQRCSVQCKEYNLIGVTAVEGGTTIGMTALVY
jgi:hypothetical protein